MRIDDAAAVAFLQDIVSVYSPSTQERAVAERIVETMAAWGYDAEIDAAGNAVGRLGPHPERLLLLGHIDTVPGEIPVRIEDGLLYGRGSVDAKGPFATFVAGAARAADAARAAGAGAPVNVTVVGAVEEEAATSKGAYHVVRTYPRAEAVVIGEPSGWDRITLGYKGRMLIDYRLQRDMSHTAGEEGSAAEAAVDYWLRVKAHADEINRDAEKRFAMLDPSLRDIHTRSDGLVEEAQMTIGLRLPPGVDPDVLAQELTANVSPAEVTTHGHELPYLAEKRNALTAAYLTSIRAEGSRATYVTKTGTSDMNVIGPRWRVPIVAYGPGDSSLDHTPNEHVPVDEFLAAMRVMERVVRRMGE